MKNANYSQRGMALLLLLLIMVGVGVTLLLSASAPQQQKLDMDAKTQTALRQTKEALIAWSATHRSTPGRLPCPEDTSLIGTPNEGNALGSCSNLATHIGRIPWRTLGIDNLRDATGEPLWYVLSPGFRGTAPTGSIGIATGKLQLDGVNNAAAALIIAPGTPLPGQARSQATASSPPLAVNYLDLGNAGGTAFITTSAGSMFNDKVSPITTEDLYRAMTFRVLAEVRGAFGLQNGLRRYFNDNGTFPAAGTALTSLNFDSQTRNWLSPSSNPDLWLSQVIYNSTSATSAQLIMGSTSLKVTPCLTTPCP